MKFNREHEIRQIFEEAGKSPNALMELERLTRLQQIYLAEFSDRLGAIWILSAKLDKILKELKPDEN